MTSCLALDATTKPLAEPSESSSRATAVQHRVAEQTAASAGPPIVLHPSESLEEPWGPPVPSSHVLRRPHLAEDSLSRESLYLDDPAISDFPDNEDIPKSIRCSFNITFDGATAITSSVIDYMEPNSYQKVEKIAHDYASEAFSGAVAAKQINFKYGNCTVIGDHVGVNGLPLTTREDWECVCTVLKNYWRSDPVRTLHVKIFRDYFSYRSRAASEVSLAATKRQEIHNLIKTNSQEEWYIPRTALMRFNSLENVREIIIQDDRLDMVPQDKESFIERVQSEASCLLALCVYASLKMECLKVLLQKGFKDAALPSQRQDCCHLKCGPNFHTLLSTRGSFQPARFDTVGEHQNFHNSVVMPINYIPVEENQDDVMKTGRRRDLESGEGDSSRATDDPTCCGSGAYSEVYRVRIDPDHHRLLQVSSVLLLCRLGSKSIAAQRRRRRLRTKDFQGPPF